MPDNIKDLVNIHQLARLPDTEAVRRTGNAYACNDSGKICALSLSESPIESLVLDESADALEHLYLNDNKALREVRFALPLPKLRLLYLSRCALTNFELPTGCVALEQLYLHDNPLTALTFQGDCPALALLDASKNQLSDFRLPAGFGNLAYLYLRENSVKNLYFPEDLPELNILDLRTNQLQELPKCKYGKLDSLYVIGNPLNGYEESLIEGDGSGNALEIIGLLRAGAKSGEQPNYRAKLIVVGNGRIGKTCLVARLLGLPCLDDQVFTHGISIKHLNKTHLPAIKTKELDLQVWDFGGQDVYFATHQFFLSEEASYIYAWTDQAIALQNREKDKLPSPAMYSHKWEGHDYWLDNIRMHGQKSPILIVKTHCLESKEQIPYDVLKDRYDLSNAPIEFDAKSVEAQYLSRLKSELTEAINALPLLGSNIPNSYDDMINKIRGEKEKGKYKLNKTEFLGMAAAHGIEVADLDKLLGYLKKTGEIIYYPDNDKLKGQIFIDPQTLIQKVYKLLENNNDLLKSEGKFTPGDAKKALGWDESDELLELLTSFKLVFQRKKQGDYISPQYLPPLPESGNAYDTFEGLKEERKLRFTLLYPGFLPDNVMVNMLSEYGPYARETVYRNCIFFRKEGAEEACVIVCDEAQKSINIFTKENEAADQVAKDVFEQFMALSKKASVQLSINQKDWMDARVIREAFDKNKDIPLIKGGWLEDKESLAFLSGEHNREVTKSVTGTKIPPSEQFGPITTPIIQPSPMSKTNRALLIAGVIAIIILLLPIWGDGRGGKINLLGLITIEIGGGNNKIESKETEKPNPPVNQKVSVIGRITVNGKKANNRQIMEVFVKTNNRVNRETLSGDQFTLKRVDIPDDNRLDIAFTFPDEIVDSRVFNVSDIRDGICDIGEIRITIEKPAPKKGSSGVVVPIITINNNNIIQSPNLNIGQ